MRTYVNLFLDEINKYHLMANWKTFDFVKNKII